MDIVPPQKNLKTNKNLKQIEHSFFTTLVIFPMLQNHSTELNRYRPFLLSQKLIFSSIKSYMTLSEGDRVEKKVVLGTENFLSGGTAEYSGTFLLSPHFLIFDFFP